MNHDNDMKNRIPEKLHGGMYIFTTEGDRNILYADLNVIHLFECDDFADLLHYLGNNPSKALHPEDFAQAKSTISASSADRNCRHTYLKYRILTKNGKIRYTESFGHRVISDDGKSCYYVITTEITEDEFYKEYSDSFVNVQINSMNRKIDNLTGLMNISAFNDDINTDAFDVKKHICSVAVFYIINLPKINRDKGRSEGDNQIRLLVRTILTNMPQDCLIYRGYDAEIVVVCSDLNEQDMHKHIKKVIKSSDEAVVYGVASTTDSFVHADIPPENVSVQDVLNEAELDLNIKKMLTNESSRSESLSSLVRALEQVDQDTEEHVKRTRKMGIALGKRLGLSDTQLSALELLCLLHDIGKIAVPLDILNKPGKLTDAEWEALRSHPVKGYQIAIAAKELRPIAACIKYHHERWDGRGYPSQLKGEEIPVLSRIISIVDAYDAMVNDRCYRRALSPQVAMQEIKDNAGTQFDPQIAEIFLQLLSDKPKLMRGKKTGGDELRVFEETTEHPAATGNTRPVVYCEYRLDVNEIIIEVDELFENITGYTPDEVIGKMSQFDLIPEEDLADYRIQVGNQFSKTDTAFLRHRIMRKDGTAIDVVCHGTRQFASATRSFMSTIQIYED